jgi:hypothetical protein
MMQLTDWLAHVPKEVIAKNFRTSIAAWDTIPGTQLYIFPAGTLVQLQALLLPFWLTDEPAAPPVNQQNPVSPAGTVPQPFSYAFGNVTATPLAGGKIFHRRVPVLSLK